MCGVTSHEATINDIQRYFKCKDLAKEDCNDKGLQFPSKCTTPPCDECGISNKGITFQSINTVLFNMISNDIIFWYNLRLIKFTGCNNDVILNRDTCLTHPNYPDKYPNNADGKQIISLKPGEQIKLVFLKFQIEGSKGDCR